LTRLLIGVPARNEARHIVQLADSVERGASMLDSSVETCLALAYQSSDDDTLERFTNRPSRITQVVLQSPAPVSGKGANVKLLMRHALDEGADHLLLVDADFGDYDPRNVGRVVGAATRDGLGLTLPLWCRPQGQANTTNHLVSPMLFATHRAKIRQPIAGHMLLHRSLLEQIDVEALPDDYGIDIAVTLRALTAGASVGQVGLVSPRHPSKEGNSERIMVEVATAILGAVSRIPSIDRSDIQWPEHYWADWEWPPDDGIPSTHVGALRGHAGSEAALHSWLAMGDAADDEVAEMWSDHLADAVLRCRAPHADLARVVDDLVRPFFVHAEYRARSHASIADVERYVAALGVRLAARLHG